MNIELLIRTGGYKILVNTRWRLCPICGNKTRLKMREDTELKNFPTICPKCRQEILIGMTNLE